MIPRFTARRIPLPPKNLKSMKKCKMREVIAQKDEQIEKLKRALAEKEFNLVESTLLEAYEKLKETTNCTLEQACHGANNHGYPYDIETVLTVTQTICQKN